MSPIGDSDIGDPGMPLLDRQLGGNDVALWAGKLIHALRSFPTQVHILIR